MYFEGAYQKVRDMVTVRVKNKKGNKYKQQGNKYLTMLLLMKMMMMMMKGMILW
jgi:hypothetical protein